MKGQLETYSLSMRYMSAWKRNKWTRTSGLHTKHTHKSMKRAIGYKSHPKKAITSYINESCTLGKRLQWARSAKWRIRTINIFVHANRALLEIYDAQKKHKENNTRHTISTYTPTSEVVISIKSNKVYQKIYWYIYSIPHKFKEDEINKQLAVMSPLELGFSCRGQATVDQ